MSFARTRALIGPVASVGAAAVMTVGMAGSAYGVGATNFREAGNVVNGFQDDFTSGSLAGNGWVEFDGGNDDANPIFTQDAAAGLLQAVSAAGDPNKLLYNGATYNNSVHEVLMRIRVTGFGTGDNPRSGAAVASNTTDGRGINYHFRDEGTTGRHTEFLNDQVAWGPELNGPEEDNWANNTFYWVRLRHSPNQAAVVGGDPAFNGANDAFAKVWLADGAATEPANFDSAWDYGGTRTGLAGFTASSLNGLATYDVDYVLIQAPDLPLITVVPEPAAAGSLAVAAVGLLARRRRR